MTTYWVAIYSHSEPLKKLGLVKMYKQPRRGDVVRCYRYPSWEQIYTDPQVAILAIDFEIGLVRFPAKDNQQDEIAIRAHEGDTEESFTRVDGFVTPSQYEKMCEMERAARERRNG